jgi:hypothetical protein
MSKGNYIGGHSVVGFSGTFLGQKHTKLVQATEVDSHLTEKKRREAARKISEPRPKKKAITKTKSKNKPALSNKNTSFAIPEMIARADAKLQSVEQKIALAERRLLDLQAQWMSAKNQLEKARNTPRRSAHRQASQDSTEA